MTLSEQFVSEKIFEREIIAIKTEHKDHEDRMRLLEATVIRISMILEKYEKEREEREKAEKEEKEKVPETKKENNWSQFWQSPTGNKIILYAFIIVLIVLFASIGLKDKLPDLTTFFKG
jgi:uncharacterized membrane protein YdbT with pleckstrin-like domain